MGEATLPRADRTPAWSSSPALLAVTAAAALVLGCATAEGARRGAGSSLVQEGRASYYAPGFAGRRTASGETYDPRRMTAAHASLPFGTWVRVTRVGAPGGGGGRAVEVRINDRCGCGGGRIVDLSEAAARHLGMLAAGVVPVRLEVIRK
jgi:rare lipoprotein A